MKPSESLIREYVTRSRQTKALVSMQIQCAEAVYMGGSRWECVKCGGRLIADCPCCAPPVCNCGRRVRPEAFCEAEP